MTRRYLGAAGTAALIALGALTAPHPSWAQSSTDTGVLTRTIAPIPGPKRTIAVGKFDAVGSFTATYGNWDIGGGLAAMLASALHETGQFIVVERANLQQVLAEQELKAGGLTQGDAVALGQNTPAQLFAYAAVTAFGAQDSGQGFSLGASGLGGLFGGGSLQETSGDVTFNYRIVDASTSQILETHSITESIESTSFNISGGYKGISLGTNQFYQTPLGEASRRGITRMVELMAARARNTPWQARVVDAEGGDIYISAGANSGLKRGDRFSIERVVKTFTDPSTGQVIGVRQKQLGTVTLTGVEPLLSYGKFAGASAEPPQRGDLVLMK